MHAKKFWGATFLTHTVHDDFLAHPVFGLKCRHAQWTVQYSKFNIQNFMSAFLHGKSLVTLGLTNWHML